MKVAIQLQCNRSEGSGMGDGLDPTFVPEGRRHLWNLTMPGMERVKVLKRFGTGRGWRKLTSL